MNHGENCDLNHGGEYCTCPAGSITARRIMQELATTRVRAEAYRRGLRGTEIEAFIAGAMWAAEETKAHFTLTPKNLPDLEAIVKQFPR